MTNREKELEERIIELEKQADELLVLTNELSSYVLAHIEHVDSRLCDRLTILFGDNNE